MKITAELLCAKGACTGQIALFRKFYPKGKNVTLAACLRHATRFNWRWAALNLLSAPAQKACIKRLDTALTTCGKACAAARVAYFRKCAAAWEARDAARKALTAALEARARVRAYAALKAHDKALAAALEARDKALTAASDAYYKAIATAFARATLSE